MKSKVLLLALIIVAIALLAVVLVAKGASCTAELAGFEVTCNANQVATWNGSAEAFNLDWTPSQDGTLSGEETREMRTFVPVVPEGVYTVTVDLGLVMVKDPSQDWVMLATNGGQFTVTVGHELAVEIYGRVEQTTTVRLLERSGGITDSFQAGETYIAFQLEHTIGEPPTPVNTPTPSPTASPTPEPTLDPLPTPDPTSTATPDPNGPIVLASQPAKVEVGQHVHMYIVNPQQSSTYFWVMDQQGDGYSTNEFPSATTMWDTPGIRCNKVTESPSGRQGTICIGVGRQIYLPTMVR